MDKKILYIDMDGVIADFDSAIAKLCPELDTSEEYADPKNRRNRIDELCKCHPEIFHDLQPIDGAIEAVYELFELFNVYFLSTAMWNVPTSFTGKRIWIEKYFGEMATARLILTHRKDLNIGDYLIDDNIKNGVSEFKGIHIHFKTDKFPDWPTTIRFLRSVV
jgi:5'(3')-deoxyribonucleotidase